MLESTRLQVIDPAALRAAITAANLTLRTVALAAECSHAKVGHLVTGEQEFVPGPMAVRIATALEVDVATLFRFPDVDALRSLDLLPA